jgi:hypothetical protein
MSRINPASSASGVRVAAQPLSNVYTVLLIIGFLTLTLSLVMLWVTLEQKYGVSFAATEPGKAALAEPDKAKDAQKKYNAGLDAEDAAIKAWPGIPAPAAPVAPVAPVTPPTPAVGGTDAAPVTPVAPVTPAPEGGADPAAAPVEK